VEAEVITSPANPLVRDIRRAVERGGLTRGGCLVAETPHLLEEAVRSGCEIEAVVVSEGARVRSPGGARRIEVPERLFRSLAATEAPQGVIALVRPPAWPFERLFEGTALVLVLDGVQDPGNAGTMLRSAEAFGATGVLCVKGTVNPYNPKAVRASAGSVFRVPLRAGAGPEDALAALAGVSRYAASAHAPLAAADADLAGPCAIIVGSEGHGVSAEMRSGAVQIRIPTAGVESLNAAMAATALLYEARRQRTT
jgi:TrmH family RNA methyltransferase